MSQMLISSHAAERYQERFAGNLSRAAARERLRRLLSRARFRCVQPGEGRLYALGEMRFLVCAGVLVTVYRPTYRSVTGEEDLWCGAA